MTAAPPPSVEREKVVSKLPAWLRQNLKVRAAQLGTEIQTAVEQGIETWCGLAATPDPIDTSRADAFATFLPVGQWEKFRGVAHERGVSLIQGLAQSVQVWLDSHPAPAHERHAYPQRIIVCNQKGGVGKTAITAGTGEAMAEDPTRLYPVQMAKQLIQALRAAADDDADGDSPTASEAEQHGETVEQLPGLGKQVLLVDFDPQCHLTNQLGVTPLPMDGDSLTKHMGGMPEGKIQDLVVAIDDETFDGRLHLLPACTDAFLLDVRLASVRAREAALERALAPLESDYDVIVVDCPPSLGMSMDAAAYYGRRREGEQPGRSGALIVVQAEDSSADAYELLTRQIEALRQDLRLEIDYLGIVVNLYDGRRGYIATSSLEGWIGIKDPRVVGLVRDLKEQKEAVRVKRPLLSYAPQSQQAVAMRALAREL